MLVMSIFIFEHNDQFWGLDFKPVANISLLRQVFVLLHECHLQNLFWNADFLKSILEKSDHCVNISNSLFYSKPQLKPTKRFTQKRLRMHCGNVVFRKSSNKLRLIRLWLRNYTKRFISCTVKQLHFPYCKLRYWCRNSLHWDFTQDILWFTALFVVCQMQEIHLQQVTLFSSGLYHKMLRNVRGFETS